MTILLTLKFDFFFIFNQGLALLFHTLLVNKLNCFVLCTYNFAVFVKIELYNFYQHTFFMFGWYIIM
jgi:hypothetical protein